MGVLIDQLNACTVGIDIGQIRDNTTVCVCEVIYKHTGKYYHIEPEPAKYSKDWRIITPPKDAEPVMRSEYYIRHIQRLPLGTSYPDVAVYIADMLAKPVFARRQVRVLLDVTGIGRAIFDDLRKEISFRPECRDMWVKPITFVHGEAYNKTKGTLGKAFLVSRLQSLLQGGRVHAPDTAEVQATIEELKTFEIKVSHDGKDTYGGSSSAHDDLVIAMSLATLEDPYADRVSYSRRVY